MGFKRLKNLKFCTFELAAVVELVVAGNQHHFLQPDFPIIKRVKFILNFTPFLLVEVQLNVSFLKRPNQSPLERPFLSPGELIGFLINCEAINNLLEQD